MFPYPEEEVAEGITDGISDGSNLSDKEQSVLAAIKKNNKITQRSRKKNRIFDSHSRQDNQIA